MNSINTSTGFLVFQLCMVMPPIVPRVGRLPVDIDAAKAEKIVAQLLLDKAEAKDNLLEAKVQQAFYSNSNRGPELVHEVGGKVMLLMMNHRTLFKKKHEKRAAKFFLRWVGYRAEHDRWPPGSELNDCEALDNWFGH